MLNTNLNGTHDDLYGLMKNASDEQVIKWMKGDGKKLLKAELYQAERIARRGGKRKTYNAHLTEANLDENLDRLTEALWTKEYEPSRGTVHGIFLPVPREIFAADYIDRIVHHWIVDTIYPWWDRRFNAGSSSCRVGKGTSYGIGLLDKHIRQASGNFARPVYVIKMDISGYFTHINREKLLKCVLDGLHKQFEGHFDKRYQILKHAITAVIMDDPVEGVKIQGSYEDWRCIPDSKSLFMAPPGVGLVIGNVTSQVFSNIYLDPLDRFIMMTLGWRYYGRYVDDFYIVVTEDEYERAKADIPRINMFLNGLDLEMNFKKTKILKSYQGVPFLGVTNYNGVLVPDKRIRKNYRRAVSKYLDGRGDEASVISYMGMMKNYDSWRVMKDAFSDHEILIEELVEKF